MERTVEQMIPPKIGMSARIKPESLPFRERRVDGSRSDRRSDRSRVVTSIVIILVRSTLRVGVDRPHVRIADGCFPS